MPQANPQMSGKRDPGQWLHIDDFSPGCYDPSNISTVEPVTGQAPGAADITGTFACSVIKGGSLGPLPALVSSVPYATFGGFPGTSTVTLLAGFIVVPQLDDGNYEVVAIFESDDGTSHYVKTYSWQPASSSLHAISGPTYTGTTSPGFFGAPYPAFTRLNATGTGNPPPKLVFPTAGDSGHVTGHLWVYPSILAPTTFVADDIAGTTFIGQVVCYGNRVICLVGQNYGWPAGGGVNTNENFNFTDPPESNAYGNQMEILAIEMPWGYGAFGSVSVGELLLVKKYGGAVILNGDINVPTSTIRIPGVTPTGDFVGRASATPIGLIYCSQDRGAYLWNGGSESKKISQNIHDSFFDLESGRLQTNNYGFFVEHWQKWVLFSGNVWFDTETESWWNVYPKKGTTVGSLVGKDFFWYSLTQNGNQMLAAPLELQSSGESVYSVIDNTVASNQYQWTSLPIHVTPNADRTLDVRQIIVRCSDPSNSGVATIKVSTPNGSFTETSVAANTPIGSDPTMLRFNVGLGAQGLQDIVIQILASNSAGHPAPIIESIDVEYKIGQSVAVAD